MTSPVFLEYSKKWAMTLKNLKIRNIDPIFSIDLCNFLEATLSDEEKANNQTEGWNDQFLNLAGQDHPSICVLIRKMRLELAIDSEKLQS